MKEFTSDLAEIAEDMGNEVEPDTYPLTFKLDDRIMHFRRPMPGEATLLVGAMASHNNDMSRFAATVDMFSRVLEPSDRDWWNHRLLDRHDPISRNAPKILSGDGDEGGLLHEIVGQWTARPTEPSDSSSGESPPPTGSPSTQVIPA